MMTIKKVPKTGLSIVVLGFHLNTLIQKAMMKINI